MNHSVRHHLRIGKPRIIKVNAAMSDLLQSIEADAGLTLRVLVVVAVAES